MTGMLSNAAPVAALEIEEFKVLSRRYRDPAAYREVSVAMLNVSPIAWSIFVEVFHYLWGAEEAYPTQAKIVARTGWCLRTVRDATRELEEAGVFVVERRKRRRPFGGFKLFYRPGPALLEALGQLQARTRARAKSLRPSDTNRPDTPSHAPKPCGIKPCGMGRPAHGAPPAHDLSPSEIGSTPSLRQHAEEPARESLAPEKAKGDFVEGGERSESTEPSRAAAPPPISLENARIAAELLAHRLKLAHPHASREHSAQGPVIALVAQRLGELGDMEPDEKLRRGRLAVEAAHRRSLRKTGKGPALGYIFGSEAYFRGHIERGLAESRREATTPPLNGAAQRPQDRIEPKSESPALPDPKDVQTPRCVREKAALAASAEEMSPREAEAAAYALRVELNRIAAERELTARRRVETARADELAALWEVADTPKPPPTRAIDEDERARNREALLAEMTADDRARFLAAEARAHRLAAARASITHSSK